MVPALVLTVLSAGFMAVALMWVEPLVSSYLPEPSGWLARIGAGALSVLAVVLTAAVGVVVALALTPPLSAPALEKLVEAREHDLGAEPRAQAGFLSEILCGLRAQAAAFAMAMPLLTLLWVIDVLAPPAVVVTFPLKYAVVALALAWNLLDYPLTLRGVTVRARLALLRRNRRTALGFGIAFVLLFWAPCCSVLLLPVGVLAAAELSARMLPTGASS
jgi:CysZ protein